MQWMHSQNCHLVNEEKKIFDKGYFIVLALHERLLRVMSKIVRGKIPGIVSIISS